MEIKIMKHDRFGEVRTVMLDDAKYYAGRDVAITLGYNRPDAFLNKHVSKDDKKIVPMRSLSTRVVRNTAVINPNGIHSLCNAACSSFANDILAWLLSDDKTAVPQIVTVEGVSGYIDDKGVAWLSAEDIARECRWVEEQCPVSGCFTSAIRQTKEQPPESGGTSFSIRWARINEYLRELGYDKEVGRGDYLPENIFYRLIWKSRSEYAKKFQSKIADVILPAIRKNGYYISEQAAQGSLFPDEEPVKKIARRPVPELAFVYGLKLSNGLTKIGVAKDLTAR
ncbi:MAG: hypothetical protein IKT98_10505, partial [Selenomonadaceae bacterium]|nr:hypothetical protein [Selenomonadaceae bacterium]